jgi:hypothetical protein
VAAKGHPRRTQRIALGADPLGCNPPARRSLQLIGDFFDPGLDAGLVFFAAPRGRCAGSTNDFIADLDGAASANRIPDWGCHSTPRALFDHLVRGGE